MTIKIYIASKVKHAQKWIDLRIKLINDSVNNPNQLLLLITSTWIHESGTGESIYPVLWSNCIKEASECDLLILYCEPGDLPLKGALVEVGAALASGKLVYVIGEPEGSWINHPLVRKFDSIENLTTYISKHNYFKEIILP